MADIKWLPDGQKAFEKVMAAVPEGMRAAMQPKIMEMLAGKAGGKKISAKLVEKFVDEDLPEPQRSVLMAALGTGKKKEAAKGFAAKQWKVKGRVKKAEDLEAIQEKGKELLCPETVRITVGAATCGLAKGSEEVAAALQAQLKKQKIKGDVVLVGSSGMSYAEPVVDVIKAGKPRITYGNVPAGRAEDIVKSIKTGKVVEDLAVMRRDALSSAVSGASIAYTKGKLPKSLSGIKDSTKVAFFAKQTKLLSAGCGTVSPGRIEEYIGLGGYQSLGKALTEMTPDQVIKEVKSSKLRGRGGAGFPAGIKWEACSKAAGDMKYIVCNGSEGDPEIGLHKSFLESDPHQVIEGMIIAGYAVGAQEGWIYVNDRYLLALERVTTAIEQAEQMGLLGDAIMGTDFSFRVKVKRGGGAYICGEETALLNALEGSFGEPRPRPPFPAEKGLFGKPTVVNNLETLANIPAIAAKGGKWFAGTGTASSKGTKIVALSGNVAQACWVEVVLGTTVEEVITTFGGGTASGKKVKAFQTGGPSGGLLPARSLKIKLDYDALSKAGSLLGSGGLLVMDEDDDVLGMARFLTQFFLEESCGKCTPCREGVKHLMEIIETLMQGRGTAEHPALVKRMGEAMNDACFCALGKTAAVPLLSVMKHFPKDVEKGIMKKLN